MAGADGFGSVRGREFPSIREQPLEGGSIAFPEAVFPPLDEQGSEAGPLREGRTVLGAEHVQQRGVAVGPHRRVVHHAHRREGVIHRPAGARIGLRQERRREIELQPLPALELAGKLGAELGELHQLGLTAAFSITPAPMDLQQAYQQAEANLEQSAEQLARLLHGLSGRR